MAASNVQLAGLDIQIDDLAFGLGGDQDRPMANTTYYVALPFLPGDNGPAPAEAVECHSPGAAKRMAEALSRQAQYVGAVAFQRTGDPDTGDFGDAEVIGKYGDVPDDLSGL